MRKLDDNDFELNQKVDSQNTERNLLLNQYRSRVEKAIQNLAKTNEKFNISVTEELKHIMNNINIE